jgi:hypothetical protein
MGFIGTGIIFTIVGAIAYICYKLLGLNAQKIDTYFNQN